MTECFACAKHARGADVTGGVIYEDALTYAGHILPPVVEDVYIGWLIVEPKRHVTGLGELSDDEASALGKLVNRLSRAVRESEGAEHIYSFVLGDAVPHLHFHVVPRYPDTPRQFWGARIGEWQEAPRGGPDEIAAVCDRIRLSL